MKQKIEDRTCNTCAYCMKDTSKETFWHKPDSTCLRFGADGIKCSYARGEGNAYQHLGPCGLEGKYWEEHETK